MLEQQNMALAKQYVIVKEENNQLHTANSRYCKELKEAQEDCYKYQTIIQMLFSRVNQVIASCTASAVRAFSLRKG